MNNRTGTKWPFALASLPNLSKFVDVLLEVWPEHQDFVSLRFDNPEDKTFQMSEEVAGLVLALTGPELPKFCDDYRWMCTNFMKEEIYFRAHGKYRLSTFQEAFDQVYSLPEYMSRYINGILLSQVLWQNHAAAMQYYVHKFLDSSMKGGDHLEVGPGHGMLLYFAENSGKFNSVTGWDVSDSSIAATHRAMSIWGGGNISRLTIQNVMDPASDDQMYDSVVLSEVLEHLDHPDVALKNLATIMRPGGQIFLNVPINSPAPDHIFLWSDPKEVVDLVSASGIRVADTVLAPVTGYSLESALERKITVTCLITGVRD